MVDALFVDAQTSPSQHPQPIHQCLQPATRVLNTLMRLVHGGSEGWHTHSTGACPKHPELEINNIPPVSSTRKSQGLGRKNEDYWEWEGEETLIRIHRRREGRISCHRIAKTVPVTLGSFVMKGKLNKSSNPALEWSRTLGDSKETTRKLPTLNEFWTGKSTFKVLANAEVID